jgi:hypothetical protein
LEERAVCTSCGASILARTAERNDGLCARCWGRRGSRRRRSTATCAGCHETRLTAAFRYWWGKALLTEHPGGLVKRRTTYSVNGPRTVWLCGPCVWRWIGRQTVPVMGFAVILGCAWLARSLNAPGVLLGVLGLVGLGVGVVAWGAVASLWGGWAILGARAAIHSTRSQHQGEMDAAWEEQP